MKTKDMFKTKTVFSLEVFPPKKNMGVETIYKSLENMKELKPDFISVTFGAGASENSKLTLDIANRIKNVCNVEPVVHLPCLNLTKSETEKILTQFRLFGIENILALRGDKISGVEPRGDFSHASDLISFIKDFDKGSEKKFNILAASYPEIHPESKNVYTDIDALKAKEDAGANHFVSQLFFDNDSFYRFYERVRLAGIRSPMEAGIMPVTNKKQIERMVSLCHASLPVKFQRILSRYENSPEALRDAGIAYAVDQIADLVTQGVEGIHLYTMNNSDTATRISAAVKSLFTEVSSHKLKEAI